MAFTKAVQVADLITRNVLPGVVVSIGEAQGLPGIEVVVKGFSHPDDGMSRLWHIDLIGQSGMMLDLTITGLGKIGFSFRGASPLMRGVLTQPLSRVEVAQMRAKQREIDNKKEKAQFKAELQAETLLEQESRSKAVEELQDEITGLREMIDDIALMPQPRGPQGRPGRDGVDGKDGTVLDLSEAELADLGNVLDVQAQDKQVLTYKDGKWQPLFVEKFSGNIYAGGSGGSGGGTGPGSFTLQQRNRNDLAAAPINTLTEVTTLSFDTDSGFEVEDLGNGEAFIKMNSSFAPWLVDGQPTLDPTGEEPVEFVGTAGLTITTDDTTTPKQIIFSTGGGGVGIEEAPQDGLAYVRRNGQWIRLDAAIRALVEGGNMTTGDSTAIESTHKDGGDFDTGASEANLPLDVDDLDGGLIS